MFTVDVKQQCNNNNIKRTITLNYPKSAAKGFFPRDSRTSPKQPSVFEPLKFYCIWILPYVFIFRHGLWSGDGTGYLSVSGNPTYVDNCKARAVLAVGACGGCLDIFSLAYHFSFLSSSL